MPVAATDGSFSPKTLLACDLTTDRNHQKCARDISCIWPREGWLDLAVILGLHARRKIGWAVSKRIKRDLAIPALTMAVAFRSSPRACIFRSDHDSRYCSHGDQMILREHGLRRSMRGKGIVMTTPPSRPSSKPSRPADLAPHMVTSPPG